MYLAISILVFIFALVLILFVLVQNSKGGGLASGFASSNQVLGAPKTADFLEKATWFLAGCVLLGCILSAAWAPKKVQGERESVLKEQVENAVSMDPNLTAPTFDDEEDAN